MSRCPECGEQNVPNARFCCICGHELTVGGPDRASRLLFFSTPLALLAISTALAWDLGAGDPLDLGASLGLTLSLFYLVSGGGFWIIGRTFGWPFPPERPWQAGLFGLGQFLATLLLSLPVQELLIGQGIAGLSFGDETSLKLGLVFFLYLPLNLAGLYLLFPPGPAAPALPIGSPEGIVSGTAAGELPAAAAVPGPEARPNEPAPFPPRGETTGPAKAFRKVGAIGILVGTILVGTAVYFLLPIHHREFLAARFAADFGFIRSASAAVDRCLAANPAFAPGHHLKGKLLLAQAQSEADLAESLKEMRQAVTLDGKNPTYLLGLSLTLSETGNATEAVQVASQAVALQPREPTLLTNMADLLLRLHRKEEAAEYYRQALRLEPNDPRILNNLAYTLIELDRDLGYALELARESVRRHPDQIYNHDTLAWAQYKNGLLADAYQTINSVRVGTASQSPEIDFHHAIISNEMGLLSNPRQVLEEIWMRPETEQEPSLKAEIGEAIASIGISIRETPEAIPAGGLPASGSSVVPGSAPTDAPAIGPISSTTTAP